MWPRIVEVMLACWLAVGPFVFRHRDDDVFQWASDFICAFFLLAFSLLSFHGSLQRMHLLNLAVAFWLIGVAFFVEPSPPPPAVQNGLTVGLLLLMIAIIPTRATEPPRAWQEYYRRRAAE